MNILSIGGRYKPTNGGNAKRISTMCETFSRLGNKVIVMTYDLYGVCKDYSIVDGVEVYRYRDSKVLVENVPLVISKHKSDVILIHDETFLRELRWKKTGLPVVYECHAVESNRNPVKEAVLKILRKSYFNRSYLKKVFVLSKNARSVFSDKYSYPMECILCTPNGVDKNIVRYPEMHFSENTQFIYGYAGTLYEFQGVNVLLAYAKRILDIALDVQIYIVGGGPLEEKVRKFVEENKLENRIIMTGSVSQDQFDNYVQKFDVMLMPRPSLPSTESAVPLKIFDAAIHKKPVVMSNVSGLTEAFSDDAALIYDTKAPEGFVDCCKKIYRNKELAKKLVDGELEALNLWPSVDDVAKMQLNVMQETINER